MSKHRQWIVAACAGCLIARPAAAYVDPAAGSMMLQLVLAGVAGLAVGVRLFWARLLSIFGGRRSKVSEKSHSEGSSEV